MTAYSVNPRAATIRNPVGEIVGTTWGGTWCWHPVNPSKYATTNTDGTNAHIIRCRKCPGCLELDRRMLADRLVATFIEEVLDIWVLLVESNLAQAPWLASTISRISSVQRCWGWCRIGATRIAVIVAGRKPNVRASRVLRGRSVCLHRVRKARGRRAWALVTAGVLYSRDVYGENVNRWYIRGLKIVPRDKRVGVWRGRVRATHPQMRPGVAGVSGELSLHPAEAYRPPRLIKRAAHARGRFAGVRGVAEPIGQVLAGLPALIAGARLANSQLSPAGKAGRAGILDFGGAKRVPLSQEPESIPLTRRYSSSPESDRREIDAWVSRMVAIARSRGSPEA